ncbi:SAM-dependent methyltransferase [Thalassobacillus pellis]|uniref:SAM-dependent methyltransferase n=1 Tax=Thalassobacillus pellis TaxID=748008 RepID=UPI00195FD186|nr:SAM-dependent methyltransferase [Thalassobacillus pellis]MBM7552296.1 SAM-dependent MidA family methyltransferase [Thalassobacillus pellis]
MKDIIKKAIESNNKHSIGYDTFIELALYHFEKGYYQTAKDKIGKRGDFYTSSKINPVFAHVLAEFFIHVHEFHGLPLAICEIGGGDGSFALDVIDIFEQNDKNFSYHIIEKSHFHAGKIKNRDLSGKIHIHSSFSSFNRAESHFKGIVFSNEWLDAQPVKVYEQRNNSLKEVRIAVDDESDFFEVMHPVQKKMSVYMENTLGHLSEGQRTELPVYMEDCAEVISSILESGVILTIDYGYTTDERSHPARREGSLRGYRNHQLIKNILEAPGSMDITHHVQWDLWKEICESFGIHTVSLMKQREFLLETGILGKLIQHDDNNPFSYVNKRNRAIRSLIMGEGISSAFDICVQVKNFSKEIILNYKKNPADR